MADHDHSYKQLFSHAALVRDLLQGFVQESWVGDYKGSTSLFVLWPGSSLRYFAMYLRSILVGGL